MNAIMSVVFGVVLLIVGLASPPSASAADLAAASCSAADIQAKIDISADGDRVIVPAGSCTWGTSDVVDFGSKNVTVIGTGAVPSGRGSNGRVVITLPSTNTTGRFIRMPGGSSSVKANRQRLSNLTFIGPNLGSSGGTTNFANLACQNGFAVVVEHLTIDLSGGTANGRAFQLTSNTPYVCGVVANNIIHKDVPPGGVNTNEATFYCEVLQTFDIDENWAKAQAYGSADTTGEKNGFLENNDIRGWFLITDIDNACRAVLRYNTITNGQLASHGYDSSPIGARHIEVYNNTFVCSSTSPKTLLGHWIGMRGGTWVVHDNAMPRTSTGPICGDAGGTVTAADASIWTLTAGQGCTAPATCYCPQLLTYPIHHQFGWGWNGGGTIAFDDDGCNGTVGGTRESPTCGGTPGTPHKLGQDTEPTYWWNNIDEVGAANTNLNVALAPQGNGGSGLCNNTPLAISTFIQQNRDYYLRAPQAGDPGPLGTSGYTTFTYPHPLTTLADAPSPPSGIGVAQQFAPVPASGLIMSSSASVTAVNTASEVSMFQFLIGPGLTATSSSQGAVVSPTYTGASSSGMTTPVLWTAPAPLHFRAIGLLAGGASTSLAIGVNLNDGIAPPSSGGGTATLNLNNSIIGAIAGPGTLARLDVYVVMLATRTAPPNSANNCFLAARFAYVNAGGSETVVNSSVVAGVNFASPTRLNVLARWSSAASDSSLTFLNRVLKVAE